MEQIHRQLSLMLLMSSILLSLIIGMFVSISSVLLWGITALLIIQVSIWSAFRRRHPSALDPAMLSYLICTVSFSLFSIAALSVGLSGDPSFLLIGLVTMFTTVTCWRRVKILRDEIFRIWYQGMNIDLTRFSLYTGEVMAACPHCMSILALTISEMRSDEKCPNCQGELVSSEEE